MPLPRRPESKSSRETEAFRRGIHERRDGKGIHQNPYVRLDLEHEPNLHEHWERGWKRADSRIKAESDPLDEYGA